MFALQAIEAALAGETTHPQTSGFGVQNAPTQRVIS